jgi:hypothetical protein
MWAFFSKGNTMANATYNAFKEALFSTDLSAVTFKAMLVTDSYTPDIDADLDRADVTNEVTGDGYTEGGEELANVTFTKDEANDRLVFDADSVVWADASITARGAVVYISTGTAADDTLVLYKDFGADKTSSNGAFTLDWGDDGILYLG